MNAAIKGMNVAIKGMHVAIKVNERSHQHHLQSGKVGPWGLVHPLHEIRMPSRERAERQRAQREPGGGAASGRQAGDSGGKVGGRDVNAAGRGPDVGERRGLEEACAM